MTMAEVQVKEWGNSLGIIIPKEIIEHDGLNKGDTIKVDIIKRNRRDGFGAFKGIGKFQRDTEHRDNLY